MKKLTKITFNGREYDGLKQMPPDVRKEYLELVGTFGADADGDGVPDALQQAGSSEVVVKESIVYNGREYKSRDELPPEARELLDHLPPSTGDEAPTEMEIKTTKVFPPQVTISEAWTDEDGRAAKSGFPWLLVGILTAIVAVLLAFWLGGVKPADLFRVRR